MVLEIYGAGNVPTNNTFISLLARAVKKGLIILNVTQCSVGKVEQGRYETGKELQQAGVISELDMTTEASGTKLMFLMGNYNDHERMKMLLKTSIAGEITSR